MPTHPPAHPPAHPPQYKFIVDGQWRHDPNLPSMYDDMGNINNVLEVQVGCTAAKCLITFQRAGVRGGGVGDNRRRAGGAGGPS